MYIKSFVRKILATYFPRLLLKYRASYSHWRESELMLIPYLCDKNKVSIDVGANRGVYTYNMMKHSKKCWAFEPNPELGNLLDRCVGRGVVVEHVAISNKNGKAQLRIPIDSDYYATIEKQNILEGFGQIKVVTVPVRKLDDYNFENVGFIKIDVEGNEEDVLRGAKNLLLRDKPSILIEAEERHRPNAVESIKKLLNELGYKGFFLFHEQLHSIDVFKIEKYQNSKNLQNNQKIIEEIKKGLYVVNFVFLIPENINKISKFLKNKK